MPLRVKAAFADRRFFFASSIATSSIERFHSSRNPGHTCQPPETQSAKAAFEDLVDKHDTYTQMTGGVSRFLFTTGNELLLKPAPNTGKSVPECGKPDVSSESLASPASQLENLSLENEEVVLISPPANGRP